VSVAAIRGEGEGSEQGHSLHYLLHFVEHASAGRKKRGEKGRIEESQGFGKKKRGGRRGKRIPLFTVRIVL